MKAFTKIISMLLVVLMVLSLCACGEEMGTPIKPPVVTDPIASSGGTDEEFITTQYLPEKVENPDDLPVLKWVCLMEYVHGGLKRTWTEEAAHEVNQLLADRNMPFRVQFVLVTMNEFVWNADWFSTPEAQTALQDADLIYARMSPEQMQAYLAPITAYVKGEASPTLENAVIHPSIWRFATIKSDIYAIPAYPGAASVTAWQVDPALLEQCDLSVEDFEHEYWEMDEIFAQIYEKNGSKPFLRINQNGLTIAQPNGAPEYYSPGVLDIRINNIGACFAIDYSGDAPTVVNYLELNSVKNYQAAVKRYQAAGYTLMESEDIKTQVSYSRCTVDTVSTNSLGFLQIPIAAPILNGEPYNLIVSGIAADTENKEEALKLLNLIAEDADFRLHLFYGKEGRDYTIEDGYYKITKTDGACYSLDFISPLSFFCGLTSDQTNQNDPSCLLSPGTYNQRYVAVEGKTALQTLHDTLDNSTYWCSARFDFTGMDTELTAVYNVLQKYFPKFSYLTTEEYNQMLQELKDAGSETVQAELQKQLDTWLTENPDWNK